MSDPAKRGPSPKLRPTVIGSVGKRTAPARVAPTVMGEPAARPNCSPPPDSTKPAAKSRLPDRPTAIPGVERRRLEVDSQELRRLFPLATTGVLRQVADLLEAFVLEGANKRIAVLWGHAQQQDYSDLVSRILQLSQDRLLVKVAGYINRMITILNSIDLEAVAATGQIGGVFGQYLKRLNAKIDSPDELETARLELDQLVRLMGASLEPLLELKQTQEKLSLRIDGLGDSLEAASLAAEFLSQRLQAERPDLARRFLDRSLSLIQTVAQIRGSGAIRQAQTEQPLHLIASIQNVALVLIPAWLGSLAALTAAMRGQQRLTPTEAGEIAYQLRDILQQLKA